MLNKLKKILNPFLFLLAPIHCEVCKKELTEFSQFKYLCMTCFDSMPLAQNSEYSYNIILNHIPKENLYIDEVFCLFEIKSNNSYMDSIYSLKYLGLHDIGFEFGELLGKKILKEKKFEYQISTSVPIHKARYRERGYNQSDFIAKGASNTLNIEFDDRLIKRKIYTKSQTLMNKSERKINVSDIFDIYSESVNFENKNIMLFDDVITTGSTLNAIAKTLKEFGAYKVAVATLASAL